MSMVIITVVIGAFTGHVIAATICDMTWTPFNLRKGWRAIKHAAEAGKREDVGE